MWEAYEGAAKRLGLAFRLKSGLVAMADVHGEIEGQKVRCVWGDRATGVMAAIEPGLDLGLDVQVRGFVTLPTLAERVLLGDSNWDEEVVAVADEAARGAVLFSGDARRALLGLNATSSGFLVTDQKVEAYVLQPDEAALVQAFQHVARVAQLIGHARRAVPTATPIEAHAKVLRGFARAGSLAIEDTPMMLAGDLRSARIAARFVRTGRGHFDLVARAEPLEGSLGAGLHVKRESLLDRVKTFAGQQDLQTGDAAFDPAFLVRGDDTAHVIAALDADVRALLLDLARRFEEVTLDEQGLSLRGPAAAIPAEETASLLEAACTVVDRVARASGAVLRGPYR